MPKTSAKLVTKVAARHGLFIAPDASAKVTALATELQTIRDEITQLNARKEEVSARLLRRVQQEGEADESGKIRLQSDDTNMVVVEAANRYIDAKTLIALGVKASIIEKATKVTEYAYVNVTKKKTE